MTQQNKVELMRERERITRKIEYIRRHAAKMCLESSNIPIDTVVITLQKLKQRRDELNTLIGTNNKVLDKFNNIVEDINK